MIRLGNYKASDYSYSYCKENVVLFSFTKVIVRRCAMDIEANPE